MSRIAWKREAREDLRSIGDILVLVEIIELAESELDMTAVSSSIEGDVPGDADVRWRRCIPRAERQGFESFDLDERDGEFRLAACDYVLAYRAIRPGEIFGDARTEDIVVLRVLSNRDMAVVVRRPRSR